MVNRGWLPADLEYWRKHYMTNQTGAIEGVLYKGDKYTKYTKDNSPVNGIWRVVDPEQLAFMAKLSNQE